MSISKRKSKGGGTFCNNRKRAGTSRNVKVCSERKANKGRVGGLDHPQCVDEGGKETQGRCAEPKGGQG